MRVSLVADVPRLAASLDRAPAALELIGRRDLRSNNSWMHNVEVLVTGKPRCTVLVHPDDAARLGLAEGDPAVVSSRVGSVDARRRLIMHEQKLESYRKQHSGELPSQLQANLRLRARVVSDGSGPEGARRPAPFS